METFDAVKYGRLLYALRYSRGYDNAERLAKDLTDVGCKISKRTIWAIERGEQLATVDRHFHFCRLLRASDRYFEEVWTDVPTTEGGE